MMNWDIVDYNLLKKIEQYINEHQGADECDIAQALDVPLLSVYATVRYMDAKGTIKRGATNETPHS